MNSLHLKDLSKQGFECKAEGELYFSVSGHKVKPRPFNVEITKNKTEMSFSLKGFAITDKFEGFLTTVNFVTSTLAILLYLTIYLEVL